ncbi:hypothetical protein [Desulfogranum japonicum]|uniref:hypothetical protein n=1 Tax=Desulfogranum japonicum TaxID=231447 RepID=UPI000416A8C2|nr:hypothetical protein [Desulfogranum japonicum]
MSRFQNHYLPCILALILAVISTWFHDQAEKQIIFKATVTLTPTTLPTEDTPLIFQLFYDIGGGYGEDDSTSFVITPEVETPLYLTIAASKIHGIRLDVMNMAGSAVMKEAGLYNVRGKQLVDLLRVTPTLSNQITAFNTIGSNTMGIQTEDAAVDPYYVYTFSPPLEAQQKGNLATELLFGVKVFFMLFTGMWIMLWVVRFSEPKKNEPLTKIQKP